MPTLSAFADEISPDIHEQIRVLQQTGIRFVELRGAFGTNVLRFSREQKAEIRRAMNYAGVGVSCIGSPIGKIHLDEPFEPHLADMELACDAAELFGAKYIRVFSFYPPKGKDIADYRTEVFARLDALTDVARRRGVTLVHENEKGIYGNIASRVVEVARRYAGNSFTTAFDAANYVEEGQLPIYDTCWKPVQPFVGYIHLKDNSHAEHRCVPLGEGDGDWLRVLVDLRNSGYDGFMAVEPHLTTAGKMAGFTGSDLFRTAVEAIRRLCTQAGLSLT